MIIMMPMTSPPPQPGGHPASSWNGWSAAGRHQTAPRCQVDFLSKTKTSLYEVSKNHQIGALFFSFFSYIKKYYKCQSLSI